MTVRSGTRGRADWLVAGAALSGALVTLLVTVSPWLRFAYLAPSLHVAMDTASGLAALLAAYLMLGRFRHSARLTELLLVVAFGLFGFASLALFGLPSAIVGGRPDQALLWSGLLLGLVASAILAAAAVMPPVRTRDPSAAGRRALLGAVGLLGVIAGAVTLFGGALPLGTEPSASHLQPLHLTAPATLYASELAGVGLFAVAALGFTRQAHRARDEFLGWLAAAATLAAFARLNHFLLPSLHHEWIYTGDVLALGFYGVVLLASAREIRRYWQRNAEAQVAEERRRLARELHDGVAQELAFIARRTRSVAGGLDGTTAAEIAEAADRARTEARRAVAALSRVGVEPFDVALTEAVEGVATMVGTAPVRIHASGGASLPSEAREHLIRIACEAVANAARHSGAATISVTFSDLRGSRLTIADDGVGFDPAAVSPTGDSGFGLLIMRERAERLGTVLRICSSPGGGTEVEVSLA